MTEQDETTNGIPEEEHDRRDLLRRGALLAAGALGAGAAGAALAPQPAVAGMDGDVVLGATNTAATQTSINFSMGTATSTPLKLTNPGGAALTLAKTAVDAGASTPVGSLMSADGDGDGYAHLQYVHEAGFVGAVMTTDWESSLFTITPFRVLDTGNVTGRRNIVGGAGNIDGAGRLKAGTSIIVALDEIYDDANAWFGNLTAVNAAGSGYLLVYPEGTPPNASTVNFAAGQTIANGFVCGSGFEGPNGEPTLRIKAAQTTRVLLDITAADTWFWATPGVGASAQGSASGRSAASRRRSRLAAKSD